VPDKFSLSQNYPNPFNPSTKIKFEIPKSTFVRITVFNSLGQQISALANQNVPSGTYETEFNGENYPSGIYYYKLETPYFTQTKKMLMIK
jgi:hypothetical protein